MLQNPRNVGRYASRRSSGVFHHPAMEEIGSLATTTRKVKLDRHLERLREACLYVSDESTFNAEMLRAFCKVLERTGESSADRKVVRLLHFFIASMVETGSTMRKRGIGEADLVDAIATLVREREHGYGPRAFMARRTLGLYLKRYQEWHLHLAQRGDAAGQLPRRMNRGPAAPAVTQSFAALNAELEELASQDSEKTKRGLFRSRPRAPAEARLLRNDGLLLALRGGLHWRASGALDEGTAYDGVKVPFLVDRLLRLACADSAITARAACHLLMRFAGQDSQVETVARGLRAFVRPTVVSPGGTPTPPGARSLNLSDSLAAISFLRCCSLDAFRAVAARDERNAYLRALLGSLSDERSAVALEAAKCIVAPVGAWPTLLSFAEEEPLVWDKLGSAIGRLLQESADRRSLPLAHCACGAAALFGALCDSQHHHAASATRARGRDSAARGATGAALFDGLANLIGAGRAADDAFRSNDHAAASVVRQAPAAPGERHKAAGEAARRVGEVLVQCGLHAIPTPGVAVEAMRALLWLAPPLRDPPGTGEADATGARVWDFLRGRLASADVLERLSAAQVCLLWRSLLDRGTSLPQELRDHTLCVAVEVAHRGALACASPTMCAALADVLHRALRSSPRAPVAGKVLDALLVCATARRRARPGTPQNRLEEAPPLMARTQSQGTMSLDELAAGEGRPPAEPASLGRGLTAVGEAALDTVETIDPAEASSLGDGRPPRLRIESMIARDRADSGDAEGDSNARRDTVGSIDEDDARSDSGSYTSNASSRPSMRRRSLTRSITLGALQMDGVMRRRSFRDISSLLGEPSAEQDPIVPAPVAPFAAASEAAGPEQAMAAIDDLQRGALWMIAQHAALFLELQGLDFVERSVGPLKAVAVLSNGFAKDLAVRALGAIAAAGTDGSRARDALESMLSAIADDCKVASRHRSSSVGTAELLRAVLQIEADAGGATWHVSVE